ncbi:MAG: hypothetical protein KF683_24075 [Rubrivivax sp.]|nr:hypothetical protein [Rubrivivax sp.]
MNEPSLSRSAARVATLTALLLLVPLVAMRFTAEVAWAPGDFAAAGVLIFGAGMTWVLAARRARTTQQKVVLALLVLAVLATVWAELAVGLFD